MECCPVAEVGGGGRDQNSLPSAKAQIMCKGILGGATKEEPHLHVSAETLVGCKEGERVGRSIFALSTTMRVTFFQRDPLRTWNTEAERPGGHQERVCCATGGERARPA